MRILGLVLLWLSFTLLLTCSDSGHVVEAQTKGSGNAPQLPTAGQAAGSGAATPADPTPKAAYAANAAHVVRVICKQANGVSAGSGFVHKSGLVVTAAHVVDGCTAKDLSLDINGVTVLSKKPANKNIGVSALVAQDDTLDLALLRPAEKLSPGLSIALPKTASLEVGDEIVYLGFPAGYNGLMPMLGVGHFAAVGPFFSPKAKKNLVRGFVNGAFNKGNSGGPVIDLKTHAVLGVVHAKMIPFPPEIESALVALQSQKNGVVFPATINGKQVNLSEAQVVSAVLQHYANQLQLVVGVMILPADVSAFLKSNKIDP